MIKVLVLYGQPENPEEFDRYYRETHVPLVKEAPGLERFELAKCVATADGSPMPYYQVAELVFPDMETMGAAFGSEAGQKMAADVANMPKHEAATVVICQAESF